jgi:hypothetical protein
MAWTSLRNSLDSKPLVLAGPILRKVTPSSVTVWLALKDSAEVTLHIFISDVQVVPPLFSGKSGTIRVGEHLHIVAVTARADAGVVLKPGEIYYYDLLFSTKTGPKNLRDGSATTDRIVWGYKGTHPLPSFAMPPNDLNDVRLIQGSCRKPNASGSDALAILDNLIEASAESATGRPHQLLLTGDQIYADEVADVLLLMLTDAAATLVGLEPLPMPFPGALPLIADAFKPTTRTAIIKRIGFTTVDHRSHLMSLGEYLAMYLFVWSDVLWPPDVPTYDDLVAKLSDDPKFSAEVKKLKAKIEEQRENVRLMRASLPSVRRALANVPTYMILDDHEVTDDWNMTSEFCENVYGNVLGMRIIQNALAAYALCQHWGNAPEQFEAAHSPAGHRLLTMFDAASGYQAIADKPELQRLLGLHTPDKLRQQTPSFAVYHDVGTRTNLADGWVDTDSLLYHYTIEAPAHQIIVTDTRTWRSFPRGKRGAPDMIAEPQIAVQIGHTPELKGRMLLVVVSTNMPASPGIRQVARDLGLYDYADAYDSWEIERIDFARAVAQLSRKFPLNAQGKREGAVVLLSGDVHASQASRIHYLAKSQVGDPLNAPSPADLVFAQLIGSALRNEDWKTIGQHKHKHGYEWVPPKIMAKIGKQDTLLEEGFVGWNPNVVKQFDELGFIFIHSKIAEHDAAEWVFQPDSPSHTLRAQEFPFVWNSHIVQITREPHYWIRLDYLKAVEGGRYKIEPRVPPSDPLKGWEQRSRSYQRYAHAVRSGREIVGMNNIGEIEFRRTDTFVDPKLTVLYTVRWQEDDISKDWVRFDVSLDANDSRYKEIPGYKEIPHKGEP